MGSFLERAMKTLDIEALANEIMSNLIFPNLELYFVVHQFPDCEDYDVVGMAYSQKAARRLCLENPSKAYPPRIVKLDLGKLLRLAKEAGALEEVTWEK